MFNSKEEMKFNKLGNTDIKVSEVCLGTMTWGEQNSEKEAHAQLDYALDYGINFIDTAEMYPVPPKEETYGKTEEYIGSWDKIKSHRDKFILASKAIGPMSEGSYVRAGKADLDKENLKQAIDSSLKRLNVEYLDLYQVHWPSRKSNYFGILNYEHVSNDEGVPILETLEALTDIQKEGKIRHFGLSNETPWGATKYIQLAEEHNLPRPISIQNPYNLLNRTYEIGLAEVSMRESMGLLAYSPLGFGVLTGKYLKSQKPEKARITLYPRFSRYSHSQAVKATEEYVHLAQQNEIDPAQMAIKYVVDKPFVTSTIIGATTLEQLEANIKSHQLKLSSDVLEGIEAIFNSHQNPAP